MIFSQTEYRAQKLHPGPARAYSVRGPELSSRLPSTSPNFPSDCISFPCYHNKLPHAQWHLKQHKHPTLVKVRRLCRVSQREGQAVDKAEILSEERISVLALSGFWQLPMCLAESAEPHLQGQHDRSGLLMMHLSL